ncbi:hypothetical protein HanRHA438_Chr13g0598371 [Helianthus annuus]|nr:hypothetical protein HanIR_Chr13g0640051 [Helianthus annuus]KAJ0858187.1 hypothetical protein HanRHA438_Chr13g0598371 [Helianthus annuus]
MVPVVSRFFTFSPHLLEIASMILIWFVILLLGFDIYSGDYPSNKMTNHREHTCYFQTN